MSRKGAEGAKGGQYETMVHSFIQLYGAVWLAHAGAGGAAGSSVARESIEESIDFVVFASLRE